MFGLIVFAILGCVYSSSAVVCVYGRRCEGMEWLIIGDHTAVFSGYICIILVSAVLLGLICGDVGFFRGSTQRGWAVSGQHNRVEVRFGFLQVMSLGMELCLRASAPRRPCRCGGGGEPSTSWSNILVFTSSPSRTVGGVRFREGRWSVVTQLRATAALHDVVAVAALPTA